MPRTSGQSVIELINNTANFCGGPVNTATRFYTLETVLDMPLELGMYFLLQTSVQPFTCMSRKSTNKTVWNRNTGFPNVHECGLIYTSSWLEICFQTGWPDYPFPLSFKHGRLWNIRADFAKLSFKMRFVRSTNGFNFLVSQDAFGLSAAHESVLMLLLKDATYFEFLLIKLGNRASSADLFIHQRASNSGKIQFIVANGVKAVKLEINTP